MKTIALLAAAALPLAALIVDPAVAYTSRADKPPAGDCHELVARYGADNVWFGLYSGFLSLEFKSRELPFSNLGCFTSEAACRLWQNENMNFSRGGSYRYSTCQRGVPARYR